MNEFVPWFQSAGSTDIKKIGYTWWGGRRDPRYSTMSSAVAAGTTYNGKTGGSNALKILLYNLAGDHHRRFWPYLLLTNLG